MYEYLARMDIAQHERAERLIVARLCGLASRYVAGQDDLDTTVAAMHAETRDPHLLAHAIGPSKSTDYAAKRALLAAAGVPAELLDQTVAEIDARLARPDFLRAFADGINGLGSGTGGIR